MAEYLIQDTTLTNIANAIRSKTLKTDLISVADLSREIENIQTIGAGTADATATSADIVAGKTAYVNGEKVTGTIQIMSEDLYNEDDYIAISDSNFVDYQNSYETVYWGNVTIPKTAVYNEGDSMQYVVPKDSFGEANRSDVITGKTFTSQNGIKITGTLNPTTVVTGSGSVSGKKLTCSNAIGKSNIVAFPTQTGSGTYQVFDEIVNANYINGTGSAVTITGYTTGICICGKDTCTWNSTTGVLTSTNYAFWASASSWQYIAW